MNLLQIRAFSRDLALSDKLNCFSSLYSGIFNAKTKEAGVEEFVTNYISGAPNSAKFRGGVGKGCRSNQDLCHVLSGSIFEKGSLLSISTQSNYKGLFLG